MVEKEKKVEPGEILIYPSKEELVHVVTSPEEKAEIEKTKKISTKEAGAYSLMDGFGLKYVSPYALSIGASNTQIGLLSSLPSLLGSLSQLITLKAMKTLKRKTLVFWGVLLQAIMWLFLLGAGTLYFVFDIKGYATSYLIIIIYTLLTLFGSFSGPAWVSWMKDLVTEDRGNYFGKRNRIAGFISFICTIIGGFLLDYFKGTKLFMGFIILFSLAFIGRAISAYLMRKQYEPKFEYDDKYYFSFKLFLKRMNQNNFGRFAIYTTLVSFAVNISAPFLTVYMIKDLGFSYVNYMTVILSPVITTILFMPLWGKFADKYGNVKTMRMSGYLTALMPLLWFLSAFVIPKQYVFLYLVFVEAFSGMVLAGFNLASANFVYDAVSRQRMAICNTYDSITTTFGVMIGALIGGYLSSLNFNFHGINAILAVFLIGTIIRFVVQITWSSKFNEVREVQPFVLEDYIDEMSGKIKKNLSLKKFFGNVDISVA